MLHLTPATLHHVAATIFEAVGTPKDIASDVADVLIDNHLAGHDSHGVLRIPQYLDWIREGSLVPDARPEVIKDSPGTALVRGHKGFGQKGALVATDVAIHKAKANGVAAVSAVDLGHTGRLGAFTERAARQDVVMFMAVGSGGPAMTVPFGGMKPSLGTNPVAFSLPRGTKDPVTLDYATSAIANGKLMLARTRHEEVPENCIIDREGLPTTDPQDYFDGGHLLPFGGHKGYALAVVADLLAGPLAGSDAYPDAAMKTGLFIFAVPSDAFRTQTGYLDATESVAARITGVPPAPGHEEVLLPGEPESRSRRSRINQGIPVAEGTWTEISRVAADVGIDIDRLASLTTTNA